MGAGLTERGMHADLYIGNGLAQVNCGPAFPWAGCGGVGDLRTAGRGGVGGRMSSRVRFRTPSTCESSDQRGWEVHGTHWKWRNSDDCQFSGLKRRGSPKRWTGWILYVMPKPDQKVYSVALGLRIVL